MVVVLMAVMRVVIAVIAQIDLLLQVDETMMMVITTREMLKIFHCADSVVKYALSVQLRDCVRYLTGRGARDLTGRCARDLSGNVVLSTPQ